MLLAANMEAFGKTVVVTLGGTFYVIKLPDDCSKFGTRISGTGQIWMDRNLGACRVAQSEDDTEAYGDLYQWGRGTDGHEKRDSEITEELSETDNPNHGDFIMASDWRHNKNDELWQGTTGTNNPCPTGFRLPTREEWQAELDKYDPDSVGKTALFNSPLKIAASGYRHFSEDAILETGITGRYWTSTVTGNHSELMEFPYNDHTTIRKNFRGFGASIRCIKD